LLDETLPRLLDGTAPRTAQDEGRATTYPRRRPADGLICWEWDANRVYDLVRAVTDPYPGAFTYLGGEKLTIWWAEPVAGRVAPGVVAVRGADVLVGAGAGALRLRCVEWRGRRVEGAELLGAMAAFAGKEVSTDSCRGQER
jgi:methionyl-tRNA formyltransferase